MVVGAHEFRNQFGYFMELAEMGTEVLVTRRGKPVVRLVELERYADSASSASSTSSSGTSPHKVSNR
jgi:prevent-host-death family protein